MKQSMRQHLAQSLGQGRNASSSPPPGTAYRVIAQDGGTKRRDRAEPALGLPKGCVLFLEIAALFLFGAAVIIGPPYYQCQKLSEQGGFFYGTTVRSCVHDRIGARISQAETFLERLSDRR